MKIDKEKVENVLNKDCQYYDRNKAKFYFDERLNCSVKNFLKSQFKKSQSVLDVGCGNGLTLLNNSKYFKGGVEIDESKEHIILANKSKKKMKIYNVKFIISKSSKIPFKEKEFDFIFSKRGPISGSSINIQSALKVLKTDGMIFEETIGELDDYETNIIFNRGQQYKKYKNISRIDEVKVLFERNSVDIRIINELLGKIVFPNIYEWLKYQCTVWSYNQIKLPPINDINKIQEFYENNKNDKGEVLITKHRVWIGGIKQKNPSEYWEYKHFK